MGCARERKATERWIQTRADQTAFERGYYFDQDAADRVIRFFEKGIRHSVGRWSGQPFILLDWQRDWLSRLYGWMTPQGFRRFREAYLEVPKKNGKSSMLSGLCLLGIFEEDAAEVYCGATNKHQAGIIYRECARMVANSPGLKSRLQVRNATKTILYPETHSRFEAMSADVAGRDGSNATTIVLDELHRFKSRELYDVSVYAGAARDQPLLINITTAGTDRNSICYELHQRAQRVISGADPDDLRFFGTIYGTTKEDDLEDEAVWLRANPSMGETIKLEDFRAEFHEAKKVPAKFANFKRLRLNLWTEQVTEWLSLEHWDACTAEFDSSFFVGRRTFATLDLSSRVDLSALTLTTTVEGPPNIVVQMTKYFCPAARIEYRSRHDQVPYQHWVDEGWLTATQGSESIDHVAIRNQLNAWRDEGIEVQVVGGDPWHFGFLESALEQDGYEVKRIGQSIGNLTACCKEFERLILDREIRHEGNPVTRWCVGNVAVITDSNENIKYDKSNPKKRIDGVATACMGVGLAMVDQPPPTPRVTLYQ